MKKKKKNAVGAAQRENEKVLIYQPKQMVGMSTFQEIILEYFGNYGQGATGD